MRLLVVEDEPRLAVLLQRGFQDEGYAVDLSAAGDDALWKATEINYDAIILDLMLPQMNGIEVCKGLRSAGRWSPIIMLTARNEVHNRIAGLDAGADDYLAKPFAFAELAARTRALIRRGEVDRPTILQVGTLILDPAAHSVRRGNDQLDLTAKEFAILELLMRHPGQVLTRDRILHHVWDIAYDASSNVIDQHVALLRKKVDRPYGREDIKTIRGVGYRLGQGIE